MSGVTTDLRLIFIDEKRLKNSYDLWSHFSVEGHSEHLKDEDVPLRNHLDHFTIKMEMEKHLGTSLLPASFTNFGDQRTIEEPESGVLDFIFSHPRSCICSTQK